MLNVLRWIGILPCAFLAFIIAFKLHLVIMLLVGDDNLLLHLFIKYISPVIAGGLAGYVFILVSIYIAPAYKKDVALIMLIVFLSFVGIVLYLGILQDYAISILQAIASIVGGILGYIQGLNIISTTKSK